MLYIDETEKYSAEEMFNYLSEQALSFKKKVGITYKELISHPVFKVNPIMESLDLGRTRQRGIKIKKIGLGTDLLAYFKFTDDSGMERTIRYTKVNIYNDAATGRPIYSPKNLEISPVEHEATSNDIAVFLFFHPKNVDSPFHEEGANYIFEYDNLTKEADKKLNKGNLLRDALNAVDTIPDLDLVYFAKGLGIHNASSMNSKTIRAELTDKAIQDPIGFLEKRNQSSIIFDGRVIEAIEKQKIKFTNNGWVFNAGLRKGQVICDVPRGITDTEEYLKNHIKLNIEEYYKEIMTLTLSIQSSKSADDYLKQVETGQVNFQSPKPAIEVDFEDVKDFISAENFLASKHDENRKPPKPKTSAFLKAVTEGSITEENLEEEITQYLAK
jgi:hypothetical protein